MEVVDFDCQRKLSSSKTLSVDHSESCQELDSLENDKLSSHNSQLRKRSKKRLKKSKKIFSESDDQSPKISHDNCVKSDNALKLFPIFTLSNSQIGHKQSIKREPNLPDLEKISQKTKLNKKNTKIGKAISCKEASISNVMINSDSSSCTEVFDSESIKPLNAEILNGVILDAGGHLKQDDANAVNDIKITKKKLTSEKEYDVLLSADSEENTIKPTKRKGKISRIKYLIVLC
ncbi:hypothetical protein TNIN_438101 [Trichonephila inaurata madagascariensis]|uniref:Uncharacterized protein n=1 Tax=Trichonephila inaurata madagascariensis TaxID=2747483 RepID=A0A8X7CKF4_9ARAC|nr:hypothetical protein TNIN_438101 [Trichonephila inaurata madagascariensis]